jgi:hypothetical protein
VSDARELGGLMERIACRGGHTQIARILSHARRETEKQKVQALVFVGDAMEEPIDDLCALAGSLGLLGVPAFVFQEGHDPVAEQAFREIARLTRGAYCRFDLSAAHELAELLRAVAAYAAGGMKALTSLKVLVRILRPAGGIAAVALAIFLGFRGRIDVAIPLGLFGLGLLGWGPLASTGMFQRTRKTPGQMSRVRSAFIEMELDHDSGAMRGCILAGSHEGKSLDALDLSTLLGLLPDIDPESRALLAAYLDRRDPGWREDAQADATAGSGATRSGKMTEEEAYQVLGVKPGATAEEIGRAHRSLMKKLHPDQGGSTYLAAQINEAKEILLRRHR